MPSPWLSAASTLTSCARHSSSSTASTVIEIDSDAPTDDEQPSPPRKRLRSSQLSIKSNLLSSATIAIDVSGDDGDDEDDDDDKWTSEDDTQPLSVLMARSARQAAARRAARRAQSVAAPQPVVRRAPPAVRRALSDFSNVTESDRQREWRRVCYADRRRFYRQVRARFAHPGDRTMCAYCGAREHSALHHEEGFERDGTKVSFYRTHQQCITVICQTQSVNCSPELLFCADPFTLQC
jgi:hypothetical protein